MAWRSKLFPALAGLCCTAGVFIATALMTPRFKETWFDFLQHSQPFPGAYEAPFVFIDLDEASLAAVGQWPWQRDTIAELLIRTYEQGAAAVAVDFLFPEPDRTSPELRAAQLPEGLQTEYLAASANAYGYTNWDAFLGDVFAQTPTVLAVSGISDASKPASTWPTGMAELGNVAWDFVPTGEGLLLPTEKLTASVAALGHVSVDPDADGALRRIPSLIVGGEQWAAGLAIELVRLYEGATTLLVAGEPNGLQGIRVGPHFVPTDLNGQVRLSYSAFEQIPRVSAKEVLAGEALPELENALVVFGASASGLKDQHTVPGSGIVSGPLFHIAKARQILAGDFPLEKPIFDDRFLGALFVLCVALALAGAGLPVFAGLGLAAVAAAGCFTASYLWFGSQRELIDAIPFASAAMASGFIPALNKAFTQEKEKSAIRNAFQSYLSPEVVAQVAADPSMLQLGGETRELTILFADIHGFTTLSESLKDRPQELTVLVNKLLNPLTEAVLSTGGTIDKYMGDCVMAFWNAPTDCENHEARAVEAAQKMLMAMEQLNDELQPEKPLKVGIGINTGRVVVGNFGSDTRFDYSCVGDAANLAARLESLCRAYKVDILVGESTADLDTCIEVDRVVVKGKTEPVSIYTPVEASDAVMATHKAFRAAYLNQHWDEAEAALTSLASETAYPTGLIETYNARISSLKATKLDADWDGVFVSLTK